MRKHLLAALLTLPCLAQAQTPFTCTVKGQLGRTLNAPAKIYLVRGFELVDSAVLKNGAFELKAPATVPTTSDLILRPKGGLGSLFGPQGDRKRLFLEPGTVTVASPDSLAHATLKGGPTTAEFLRLEAAMTPIIARMQTVSAEALTMTGAQRQAPGFQEQMQARFRH